MEGGCEMDLRRDRTFIMQNFHIVELQKRIQLRRSICHRHGTMPPRLPGRMVQIHGDDLIEFLCLMS